MRLYLSHTAMVRRSTLLHNATVLRIVMDLINRDPSSLAIRCKFYRYSNDERLAVNKREKQEIEHMEHHS